MEINELNRLLGNVDNYLLDQILKGRFTKEMKILDAGCGEGRNTVYFINQGYSIFGIDPNELAIQYCRYQAKSLVPNYDTHRFQPGRLEEIPFHNQAFDALICSAVLHFAENVDNFWQMIEEIHRVLKPGGIFWFRMCTAFSDILEKSEKLEGGKYRLPDESERFVLTHSHVDKLQKIGFQFLEAPKTVLVLEQREMGVFLLQKQ
ncbi:MAG: class I SAM-dependent methyltransferase [Cyclobacteriaceae bacterium]|jgi:ubiquinone/menaquinone biosynthesis C-methylase UbiE|uniref:Class I SAM-dependent methyltransferase n=1 Tax=Algoriphagus marincola TaxID=264027 RepID=A0ABS7N5R0_9BACT|nr:class I SAM-dependent methyltransferase [Algoriphagus marincola]MBY5951684.1 class I SAM-dependent methyltransferase [Algoriphagus marincola]MCR9082361.1 class I SAM-dependent methyltransferase [Cyclobacteriaceae bacterium]